MRQSSSLHFDLRSGVYGELPDQWELCFSFRFRWHASANGLNCGVDSKANEPFAWIRLWIGMVHCRIYRRCKISKRADVRIDHLADRSYPNGHIFSPATAFGLSRPEIRRRSLLHLPLVLDRAWSLGC